jgi:lipoprotein-anchoring transpeptidase ErfK/SrfK
MYRTIRLLIILCILFALAGCGSSDIYPIDRTPLPTAAPGVEIPASADDAASEWHEEAPVGEKQQLPAADRDKPVEDNINAEDIEEDAQITDEAQAADATQDQIGTSPEDCETCDDEDYPVVMTYSTTLPEGIVKDLLYTDYEIAYDYVLVLSEGINIRSEPATQAEIVKKGVYGEKFSLIATVRGEYLEGYESDNWHKVTFKEEGAVKTGYLFAPLAAMRTFQFERMHEELENTKRQVDGHVTAYISNYKNYAGTAPLLNGRSIDDFGYRRYQSAPGYVEPDKKSYFRYLPDGLLLNVLEETDTFFRVKPVSFDGEYYVEKKYLSFKNSIQELTQVTVVDRENQNGATFAYRDGTWVMVSYTFVTTGMQGQYSLPTPLGHYMAIQKRDRFLYYADGTQEIDGYAPYAIRFSGGGYIHGVPVQYRIEGARKIDPGMKEYLHTIGTTPRSHMCVRNYTSHAKFLYDWMEIGQSAVIVIE